MKTLHIGDNWLVVLLSASELFGAPTAEHNVIHTIASHLVTPQVNDGECLLLLY